MNVVVIGAGLSGLSTACHLAGRGHDVDRGRARRDRPVAAPAVSSETGTGSTPGRPS